MYEEQASLFYYLTVGNESYVMPSIPNEDVKEGILKGMYKYKGAEINKTNLHAELLGSGSILNEVLKAGQIPENQYDVATDVWSVTSYKQLYRDGDAVERWNMFHPSELVQSYLCDCMLRRCAGRICGGFELCQSTS